MRREKNEAVIHAAELQQKLDEANQENLQLRLFIQEMGLQLLKGPLKM